MEKQGETERLKLKRKICILETYEERNYMRRTERKGNRIETGINGRKKRPNENRRRVMKGEEEEMKSNTRQKMRKRIKRK